MNTLIEIAMTIIMLAVVISIVCLVVLVILGHFQPNLPL